VIIAVSPLFSKPRAVRYNNAYGRDSNARKFTENSA
jgi:hypothetical protein